MQAASKSDADGAGIVGLLHRMIEEVDACYVHSVKRSTLEYALLVPAVQTQHGIDPQVLQVGARRTPVVLTRQMCDVDADRVAWCRKRVEKNLFIMMAPVQQAKDLMRNPSSPFYQFTFSDVNSATFGHELPMSPPDFFQHVEQELERSFHRLQTKWRKVSACNAIAAG